MAIVAILKRIWPNWWNTVENDCHNSNQNTYIQFILKVCGARCVWYTLVSTTYCTFTYFLQEVSQLASSLYTTGTNLSRSVSSAGEHQSEAYVSPILPKRAETFGGFDNSNQGPLKLLGKKLGSSSGTPAGTPDLENLKPGDSKLFVSFLFGPLFDLLHSVDI